MPDQAGRTVLFLFEVQNHFIVYTSNILFVNFLVIKKKIQLSMLWKGIHCITQTLDTLMFCKVIANALGWGFCICCISI